MREKQKEIVGKSEKKLESSTTNEDRIENKKQSKVLHKIEQIIESYTEKCKITSIKIEEDNRKLIIASKDRSTPEDKATTINPTIHVKPLSSEVKEEPELDMNDDRMKSSNDESIGAFSDTRQDSEHSFSLETVRNLARSNQFINRKLMTFQSDLCHFYSFPVSESTEILSCNKGQKPQDRRRKRMEILRLPNNQDLYERHKAQARERTRRYRAKMRQLKLQEQPPRRLLTTQSHGENEQASIGNFPFFQFAEVKLEQLSDDDKFKS